MKTYTLIRSRFLLGTLFILCLGLLPQIGHAAAADGRFWTEATTTAWSGTDNGFQYVGSAVHDDAVWAVLSDGSVWSSEDGIDWEMATSSFVSGVTVFWDFGMVSFEGELWIVGGDMDGDGGYVNTVWRSDNGIEWNVATSSAEWEARSDMAVGVFDEKIWLTGGENEDQTGLWYSEDGVEWVLASSTPMWGVVNGAELIEFDGSFWLLGGQNDGDSSGVWSSPDGLGWTFVDEGPWAEDDGISYFGAAVFNDKLYVLGGYTSKVWSTEDGEEWELMVGEAPWEFSGGQGAQSFDGRLFVFGGDDPYENTVWYSAVSVTNIFDPQGGSAMDTIIARGGATTTLPAAPTRSGYTFQNWNTASNGSGTSYAAGALYTYPMTDTTLYAIWQQTGGGGGGGNGSRSELRNDADRDTQNNDEEDIEESDNGIVSLQEKIETLKKQLADLMSQTQSGNGGTSLPAGVRDLQYGDEGGDVRILQNLLIKLGYSIPAGATNYFLGQTQTALSLYQKDKGITPANGYFGPITRAQMKSAGIEGLWW